MYAFCDWPTILKTMHIIYKGVLENAIFFSLLGRLCLRSCATALPLPRSLFLDAVWRNHTVPDACGSAQHTVKEMAVFPVARIWLVFTFICFSHFLSLYSLVYVDSFTTYMYLLIIMKESQYFLLWWAWLLGINIMVSGWMESWNCKHYLISNH